MANQAVKVRRETIEACMTCPLCNKLFRDATTISECLHTFCRKCIYDKISDEEIENCPKCNTDLGCIPLEKLRPDHNLQDLRAKVFPIKGRKVKAPEVLPAAVTLPVRRKERSLSSLVVSTPRVSAHAAMTGRRTKAVSRKALRCSGFSIEKSVKKEEDSTDDHPESSSSPETSNKFSQNTKQSSLPAEPSQAKPTANKETENGSEHWEGKTDLWKPLNCLVEVANRTKSLKSSSQRSDNKVGPTQDVDSEHQLRRSKIKENKRKSKVYEEKNTDLASSETAQPKKLHRVRRKREAAFGESRISPQAVLDAASGKHERRIGPIWFSLVASEDQGGSAPLPQIRASYLRIKNGNLPVSFIQKYLMMKLDLTSEYEVEIKCMGQPVVPTLQLYNLVDLWLQTSSTSERIPATIGSSAKDFVMVLAYARKMTEP